MNITDKLYTEWAWRSKTGTPDINNPEDKAILDKIISEFIPESKQIHEEEEKKPKAITKKDIINYISNADLDDEQIVKLYQRVTNFGNYRSIRDTIKTKGYGDLIYKQYSQQIQNILEDLPAEDSKKFSEFLQGKKQPKFPTNSRSGNIMADLAKDTNLPQNVITAIFKHTAQDERKRGVGMGELALTLLFSNVTNTASGKGDLAIDGNEFEIKGTPALLGGSLGSRFSETQNALSQFGVQITPGQGGGIVYKDRPKYNLSNLAGLFVDLYANEDKAKVKQALKDILQSEGVYVEERFNKINFSDSSSINVNVGLMNFMKYAEREGYKHFLVHDYGAKGSNTGSYIYVSGSPSQMADALAANGAKFQGISPNLFRPRMGVGTKGLRENETE